MMSLKRSLACLLLIAGALLAGNGAWIHAKAWLAQVLLERSWEATLADGGQHRPWPWADHWPVARLQVPSLAVDLIVLTGDAGNVLAFAPGHNPGSGLPEEPLTTVISGHRDTHFAFLGKLPPGTEVLIDRPSGRSRWLTGASAVVDASRYRAPLAYDNQLLLVTCWLIDPLAPRGNQRLIVTAQRAPAGAASS